MRARSSSSAMRSLRAWTRNGSQSVVGRQKEMHERVVLVRIGLRRRDVVREVRAVNPVMIVFGESSLSATMSVRTCGVAVAVSATVGGFELFEECRCADSSDENRGPTR